MNTTISIDKEIRDKAAKKAKRDKISVSAITRILLTEYAEGKIQIGTHRVAEPFIEDIEVDEETQGKMDAVFNAWDKIK